MRVVLNITRALVSVSSVLSAVSPSLAQQAVAQDIGEFGQPLMLLPVPDVDSLLAGTAPQSQPPTADAKMLYEQFVPAYSPTFESALQAKPYAWDDFITGDPPPNLPPIVLGVPIPPPPPPLD